ncbi:MAG: hypothetical protein HWQ36_26280 [Nostoc sp. NMS2]|uniref:hypothetical protein n=1 Tax=Nostoc sp. NMS2 TaxID=2815389 RepID=UPI0025E0F3C8|nr:hypothetical protein [Nostoc sp. NMS2]MBN3993896.1 hypothetical protein [Nostoc sp. NMS2]
MPIIGSKLATSKLDTDVANFKNRIIADGGTISNSSLQAHNTFVKSLKLGGIWDKCLEIATYAGNDLNAALVKLKYPSGIQSSLTNVGFVNADYSEITGLSGDTSNTKYLKTGFIPSVQLTSSLDAHLSVYARNTVAISGSGSAPFAYLGCNNTTPRFYLFRQTSTLTGFVGSSTEMSVTKSTATAPGHILLSTVSSNLGYLFYNGNVETTDTSFTTNARPTCEVSIFSYDNGGTQFLLRSNLICGMHTIGYGLDTNQATIFYNAVQALQTALGRQV